MRQLCPPSPNWTSPLQAAIRPSKKNQPEKILQSFILQINSVRDISRPAYQQLQKVINRFNENTLVSAENDNQPGKVSLTDLLIFWSILAVLNPSFLGIAGWTRQPDVDGQFYRREDRNSRYGIPFCLAAPHGHSTWHQSMSHTTFSSACERSLNLFLSGTDHSAHNMSERNAFAVSEQYSSHWRFCARTRNAKHAKAHPCDQTVRRTFVSLESCVKNHSEDYSSLFVGIWRKKISTKWKKQIRRSSQVKPGLRRRHLDLHRELYWMPLLWVTTGWRSTHPLRRTGLRHWDRQSPSFLYEQLLLSLSLLYVSQHLSFLYE